MCDLDPIDIPTDDELLWDQLIMDEEDCVFYDPLTGASEYHRKCFSDTALFEYCYYYILDLDLLLFYLKNEHY